MKYSSQGRMDTLDPAIVLYISKELLRAAQVSGRPEELAEAKYGLAVLSINGAIDYEQGSTLETGLKWLAEAAEAGCDRAQAIFYRIYTTLGKPLPASHAHRTVLWLLNSASKGFFQPLEDMREHIGLEAIDDVLRTLRFKYSGTGSQRYDDLLQRHESRQPWEISAVQIQKLDTNLTQMYKSKDQGYIHGGGGFRNGDNILHHAASCGLRKTVDYLIGKDSNNINCINISGETPLLLACRSGHYFVTMQLLEADADPKIASHSGDTPLHWLLSFDSNHLREVCRHLVAKLDQNSLNAVASEWGYIHCGENKCVLGTPLMRAVARNRLDVVQALLEAGADPSFAVKGGSALNIAAQLHYPHMIKVLLPKLPPNSLRGGTVERSTGRSLLIDAIRGGSLEAPGTLFARLRRHGYRWRSRALETLQLLVDLGSKEDLHDTPGWPSDTALSLAAMHAEMDVVEFLLEHGYKGNIDKPSKIMEWSDDQYTPLMGSILSKNFPVFGLLVKNGANTKALAHGPVPYTLLYECAQSSNDRIEFAQALIDFGVQVDQRPEGYETPFACALRNRCFNLAKCLWENGADVNIEYSKGRFTSNLEPLTVLGHLIAEYTIGSLSCLSFLLCHRPQLSAADFVVSRSAGLSALHVIAIASYQNQNDSDSSLILGCILDYFKPTPEQLSMRCSCDKYEGNTALHIAALRSNYPIVRGLLSAGADPFMKNMSGFTALDLAYYALQSFPDTFKFGSLKVQERTLKKAKERAEDIIKTIESACNDRQEYSQGTQSTNAGE
jgi:ankyrin repeat protein